MYSKTERMNEKKEDLINIYWSRPKKSQDRI